MKHSQQSNSIIISGSQLRRSPITGKSMYLCPCSFTVNWTWLRDGWAVARKECLTRAVHQFVSGTADRIIYTLPLSLCCLKPHPDPRTRKCDLRPYNRTVLWAGGPSKTYGRELLDRKRAWHVWTTQRPRRPKK